MMNLSDTLRAHKILGRRFLSLPRPRGEVQVTLRDAKTGEIRGQEKKGNLTTRYLSESMAWRDITFTHCHVFMSNEIVPAHIRRSFYRATYWDEMSIDVGSPVVNTTSKTWTWTATFPATTAGHVRRFQTVGVSRHDNYGGGVGDAENCIMHVMAATLLTQEYVQDESTIVEIIYRFTFERVV